MKLLLVDDEIVALNALKRRVDWIKYGFSDVYTAMDADNARKMLDENTIDLVLCDIEMPGDSGLILSAEIRDNYENTEVIMVTCHSDFDSMKSSMQNRVRDYLLKPIDYDELDLMLKKYIEDKEKRETKDKIDRIVRIAEEKDTDEITDKDPIEKAEEYIEKHLSEKIYVENLAKIAYMNEQYFMRVFKKRTQKSVTEYITDKRMQLAAQLLRDTDKSISFIADAVGITDDAYFSRSFKKHSGISPTEYRNRFSGKS
ncbi:response regulator transcription factor [Butyrivibrio sp. AC2005]|uniref:response regulator transcription factor n=1 Tax=Butyrivibrio sp. AC2005 TaxID=1280672 RepID=UPI000406E923|nr:response regulator [Butyrivibrio sp. AC2005]